MRAQLQWMMMSVELALPFKVQATISDRMPKIFKDSTIARQWACSKTKATVLVVEVLSPELHDRLLRLLRANPYSLMIDETTCRAVQSHMGVVVKVFDPARKQVLFLEHSTGLLARFNQLFQSSSSLVFCMHEKLSTFMRRLLRSFLRADFVDGIELNQSGIKAVLEELANPTKLLPLKQIAIGHKTQAYLSSCGVDLQSISSFKKTLEDYEADVESWQETCHQLETQFQQQQAALDSERQLLPTQIALLRAHISSNPAIAADQVNDLVEELHESQADRVAARYAEQHKDALQFWVKVGQELTVVPMLTDSSEMGDAGTVQQQRFPLIAATEDQLAEEALRLLEATDLLTNDVADLWGTQGEGEKVLEELEELL
eukprot:gene13270-13401_t